MLLKANYTTFSLEIIRTIYARVPRYVRLILQWQLAEWRHSVLKRYEAIKTNLYKQLSVKSQTFNIVKVQQTGILCY